MITCTLLLIFAIFGAQCGETHVLEKLNGEGARQKRLLFYDEEGNLVKTYQNPYLRDLSLQDKLPFYGNYLNPFFAFIRASYGGSLAAFAIPVSSEVLEQIQNDPVYQHKLVLTPKKDPIIAPNTLCEGKRTQVLSKNCNNFLNCWDGWAFEQECPQGLLFSKEGYCDYAHNVDCNNREILHKPEVSQPVLPPAQPPQPQPPAPPQAQPQPKPPAQPQPQPQPHPPVQPQQPATSPPQPAQPQPQPIPPCQPQTPAQVQQPQPPVPVHPQKPQTHPMPLCKQDFESFMNRYNCSEFFVCVNRQPVKFQCPADLAYSQYLGVCDYPDRVECTAASSASLLEKSMPQPSAAAPSSKPGYSLPPSFFNYNQVSNEPKVAMSSLDAIRQLQGI